MSDPDPFQLEPETGIVPAADLRPKMPEPLPVKLVAIEDVVLSTPTGLERKLDDFYVRLLQFVRDESTEEAVYRADNFSLRFRLHEGLVRHETYRNLQVEIQSLRDTELKLIEAKIEYTRQRGLTPGMESLLLLDPAGNWVELLESRAIL